MFTRFDSTLDVPFNAGGAKVCAGYRSMMRVVGSKARGAFPRVRGQFSGLALAGALFVISWLCVGFVWAGLTPDYVRHLKAVGFDPAGDLFAVRIDVTVGEPLIAVREIATGAKVVEDPNAIYDVDADIFTPCALGAIINPNTIDRLKVKVVAGAANNQLETRDMGAELVKRGILYAPDYVINAGGLINAYGELNDWTADRSKWKAGEIYGTLLRIFERAKADGIPPHLAANKVAETRIQEARHLQRTFRA